MIMNINDVLKVLNALSLNYTINHTNDYSELIVPRNNDLVDAIITFDKAGDIVSIQDDNLFE